MWQGSKESGVYGVLGKILPATNGEPDRSKGEYHKWEDKIPKQDFILKEGTNLTMAYMKVLSGVNIIVENGAVLNLYDSSIFGKITVDGGTLRVNYDTEGKFTSDIEVKNPNKLISGTSIQGQIILKNGAVLEDSYVYSHKNNLVDGGAALENIRPVVLVQGKAFIKGNVFIRGDESPTGEDKQTKKVYRGQNAMAIENGSLTIADKSSLYLYEGGTNVTTSLGGNALELKDGKVLGEGTLVAMGGVGHAPIKDENIAGYAVVGRGDISCEKVYLRSGNAYAGSEEQRAIKSNDGIKIHKNVKGKIIDSKGWDGEYREYWKRSSIPYKVDSLIPNEILRPDGDEKIFGEAVPADIFKPGKKIKRVDLKSSNVYQKSIAVSLNDEGRAWLEEIKNKYENETTGQRETGHYEYRKLVRNGEGKVHKTEKTKVEEGYIEGYPDGSFKPENSITKDKEKKDEFKLKKVKFEAQGWIPTLQGIKISRYKESQEWLKAISEGRSEIKKEKGEKIEKQKHGKEGYSANIEASTLQISGLKEKDTVTIEVEGYETVTLEAKNDSWGIYYLTQVENTKKSEGERL